MQTSLHSHARFTMKFCERGDVFVLDANTGDLLWSPYDHSYAHRSMKRQFGETLQFGSIDEASRFIAENRKSRRHIADWEAQLRVCKRFLEKGAVR